MSKQVKCQNVKAWGYDCGGLIDSSQVQTPAETAVLEILLRLLFLLVQLVAQALNVTPKAMLPTSPDALQNSRCFQRLQKKSQDRLLRPLKALRRPRRPQTTCGKQMA